MASSRDLDILAWTMLGEAGGEGSDGMADVGHVILNRLETGKYGSSISDVALANKQFSAWNKGEGGNDPQGRYPKSSREFQQARQLAEQVVSGAIPGPPGKPLDYHTPNISPYWASSKDRYGTYERNGHLYYPSQPVPPAEVPNTVATQTDTQRPQRIMGQSNTPTSAASRLAPTRDVTPRLAPGNSDVYAYNIPGRTNASLEGGYGSLTPTVGQRPPIQLPRPRPARAAPPAQSLVASNSASTMPTPYPNFAASTTPARLPPLPPSNPSRSDPVGVGPTSLASVQDMYGRPAPSRQDPIGPGPSSLASVQDMYGRPPASRMDPVGAGPMSLASVQDMYGRPGGVGLPPTTRSVPSVPVRTAQAGPMNSVGSMPSFASFSSAFASPPPAVPTTAVPGPNAFPKGDERLVAGIYYPDGSAGTGVGTALDVVPGFPPLPRNRPLRSGVNVQMPTPMGQRPTLPMPRAAMGFPTALAQRPNPNALRITVNGANSYSGGGSFGGSSGGSQPRYVMKGTGKEVSPQVINWFNPDAPNGGAFEKRTVYR